MIWVHVHTVRDGAAACVETNLLGTEVGQAKMRAEWRWQVRGHPVTPHESLTLTFRTFPALTGSPDRWKSGSNQDFSVVDVSQQKSGSPLMRMWNKSQNWTWLNQSYGVVYFPKMNEFWRTVRDPRSFMWQPDCTLMESSKQVTLIFTIHLYSIFHHLEWFLSLKLFFLFVLFSQLCVNSISWVLQHCCCYVCLRYISTELQRLRHSPHYINPPLHP